MEVSKEQRWGSTDFTMSSFVKGGIDYVPLKFRLTKNPDETYHGPYTYRRNKKTEVEKDG